METIDHDALVAMLDRLKLTAIRDQLDTLLDEAARSDMTLREALGFLAHARRADRLGTGAQIADRARRRGRHGCRSDRGAGGEE